MIIMEDKYFKLKVIARTKFLEYNLFADCNVRYLVKYILQDCEIINNISEFEAVSSRLNLQD